MIGRTITKQDIINKGYIILDQEQIVFKDNKEIYCYPVKTIKGRYLLPKIINTSRGRKKQYVGYTFGRTTISAARLFYAWFHGTVEGTMDVDHVDNNPFNNTIDNLQQLTHSENIRKKYIDDPENLEIDRNNCRWARYCKYCKSIEMPLEIR